LTQGESALLTLPLCPCTLFTDSRGFDVKKIRFLVFVAAIAFCLILPFAIRGYRGDDFQFHFDSWIGLRQAWIGGNFIPGWDSLANYTFGDPRFCFYPPISLYLGALLSTILPVKLAPAAFVWLALVLSALSMYAASKSIVGDKNRALAAVLYMISPYILVAAITRFAVAELLVLAWLPLIVLYFLRATTQNERQFTLQSTLLLGGLLALTWLTNLPASIVLAYVLFFVSAITAVHQRSVKALLHFLAAESVAVLVAAFYLIPAFIERGWITTSALLKQDFRDYFIFGSFFGLHRMFFILGLWAITLVQVAIIVACIVNRGRMANSQHRLMYELAAVAFLFELPVTAVLWLYLPAFRYIQFPFRFLAIIGAVLPLIVIGSGASSKLLKSACGLMTLLALLPLIAYLRISPAASSGIPDLSAEIRQGYPGTVEYVPTGAVTQNMPITLTPASVTNDSSDSGCRLVNLSNGPHFKLVSVDAQALCRVRFATYFYPYWMATDEAGKRLQTSRDDAGLLVVTVPAGQHTVQIRFHAYSPVRVISMAVSLVAFLFLALELWKYSRNSTSESHASELNSLAKAVI
jgi:hypothetical protein